MFLILNGFKSRIKKLIFLDEIYEQINVGKMLIFEQTIPLIVNSVHFWSQGIHWINLRLQSQSYPFYIGFYLSTSWH